MVALVKMVKKVRKEKWEFHIMVQRETKDFKAKKENLDAFMNKEITGQQPLLDPKVKWVI